MAMRCYGVEERSWEKMILKVMDGDAGEVVSSMFDFGGGSGAALPATLVSWILICCRNNHLLQRALYFELTHDNHISIILSRQRWFAIY